MTLRRKGAAATSILLCLVMAPAAAANHSGTQFTGHSTTATASCSGGTGFVVDGNALFGQQTETAAWNAGDHGTTCGVTLNP